MKSHLLVLLALSLGFCLGTGCKPSSNPVATELSSSKARFLNEALARSLAIYRKGGNKQAVGSGLLIDNRGHVLSNLHLITAHPVPLSISQNGRDFYDIHLFAKEPKADLVLFSSTLKKDLPALKWAPRDSIKAGIAIYGFGSPWGLTQSYLEGYVAHQARVGLDNLFPTLPLIQTMGISYPGTSGAPLYDSQGRIIGLNRATFGYVAGNGIGLAIPVDRVRDFIESKLPHK